MSSPKHKKNIPKIMSFPGTLHGFGLGKMQTFAVLLIGFMTALSGAVIKKVHDGQKGNS